MSDFETSLAGVLYELSTFLLEKNEAYGNSAFCPINIFSKANALEQIDVRIDDKLNRLMKGKEYIGDDTVLDLIGYLIIRRMITNKINKGACNNGQEKSTTR
ncbi:MAG: hypothetical protein AMQ74_01465 [Candidatus Methanofastidiosum methylothiophilum]|uniref:Nucleotide modification associated domain-containing protein n=1 Tax=Candidatus Methanofastidiosum methylothiophilum TaxID=1705564 RepID=A0A150IW37_9EURY|nr:MAG: hypothetical protein AMQ74_01465 [Candidatus Methanofastidiosum methylthiophilus]